MRSGPDGVLLVFGHKAMLPNNRYPGNEPSSPGKNLSWVGSHLERLLSGDVAARHFACHRSPLTLWNAFSLWVVLPLNAIPAE